MVLALEPVLNTPIPLAELSKIQAHFHAVIRSRAATLVDEHYLRLPELEPLTELPLGRGVWLQCLV